MELNKIVRGSKKSENQKNVVNYIKKLYESREKVIELFDDYSRIVPEVKYKKKYGRRSQNINSKINASKITNSTCTSKSR